MCRLFGFRSKVHLPVHHSLLKAENALAQQSEKHCDGWGLGYYNDVEIFLEKSPCAAHQDEKFHLVAEAVSAQTVIAHIRLATIGENHLQNTHPFQYKQWLFAHNGEIQDFLHHRDNLLQHIIPKYRQLISGETDSECIFYLFMSMFEQYGLIDETKQQNYELPAYRNALREIMSMVLKVQPKALMNFILTDGNVFFAYRHGKEFYYTVRKKYCPEIDTCPKAGPECVGPGEDLGTNTHCMVASEIISNEDIWHEIPDNHLLMTDSHLHVFIDQLTQETVIK